MGVTTFSPCFHRSKSLPNLGTDCTFDLLPLIFINQFSRHFLFVQTLLWNPTDGSATKFSHCFAKFPGKRKLKLTKKKLSLEIGMAIRANRCSRLAVAMDEKQLPSSKSLLNSNGGMDKD
jgi:hypothetical protein